MRWIYDMLVFGEKEKKAHKNGKWVYVIFRQNQYNLKQSVQLFPNSINHLQNGLIQGKCQINFFQKLIYNMVNVVFKSYLLVFLLAQNFFKLLSYGTKVYDILKQYGIVQWHRFFIG